MIKEITKTYPVRKKVANLPDENPRVVALEIAGGEATVHDTRKQVATNAANRLFVGDIDEIERLKEEILAKSARPQAKIETEETGRINLNTAAGGEIAKLANAGAAAAIIARRPIETIDSLADIPGIGPATIRRLKQSATL